MGHGACNATCEVELGRKESTKFDLHPAENALFGFIYGQVARRNHTLMREILGGGHVRFRDPNRCAHAFLVHLKGAYNRISSHFSTSDQVGIKEGRVVHTILIGTLAHDVTWFQLEGEAWDPTRDIVSSIKHGFDAVAYVISQHQMGPLGMSVHTDKNPLVLPAPSVPDYCQHSCTEKLTL